MKTLCTTLLLCAVVTLSGCLSYSHNQLKQVEQWPLGSDQAQAPSAYIKIETQYLHNEKTHNAQFNLPKLEELILDEYQSSQRFTQVTTERVNSDLYIDIRLTNHERSNLVMAFISGFSLMMIPTKADNELIMETTFKDAQGTELGKVTKRESLTTWIQIGLIFAIPFNPSLDPILSKLTRSTLEEATDKGLI